VCRMAGVGVAGWYIKKRKAKAERFYELAKVGEEASEWKSYSKIKANNPDLIPMVDRFENGKIFLLSYIRYATIYI